jgi:hypothetical protein
MLSGRPVCPVITVPEQAQWAHQEFPLVRASPVELHLRKEQLETSKICEIEFGTYFSSRLTLGQTEFAAPRRSPLLGRRLLL